MNGWGPYLLLAVSLIDGATFVFVLNRPLRGARAGCLALAGSGLMTGWFLAYSALVEGGSGREVAMWAAAGLVGTAMLVLGVRGKRRALRPPAPGHCTACGYDLRGAPPGPCPECGRASDLSRSPAPPATAPRPAPPGTPSPPR
jgi:hypothetical protein